MNPGTSTPPDPAPPTIGAILRRQRQVRDLTLQQAGERFDRDAALWWRYERDQKRPNDECLAAIAEGWDCPQVLILHPIGAALVRLQARHSGHAGLRRCA